MDVITQVINACYAWSIRSTCHTAHSVDTINIPLNILLIRSAAVDESYCSHEHVEVEVLIASAFKGSPASHRGAMRVLPMSVFKRKI